MAFESASPIPFAGRATYRKGILRIEGRARYPNDFSTAALEPLPETVPDTSKQRAFSLVFHRDKEPYCDADLIGPVVYERRSRYVEMVRVYVTPDQYDDIRVERYELSRVLRLARDIKAKLLGRLRDSRDVFMHGTQAVLQASIVDALETRIKRKPGVIRVL